MCIAFRVLELCAIHREKEWESSARVPRVLLWFGLPGLVLRGLVRSCGFGFPGGTVGSQTSDDCGFFCLAVMVECLSLRRGEGPKQRGSQHSLVADLKTKLSTFTSQLKAETDNSRRRRRRFSWTRPFSSRRPLTRRNSWRSRPRRRRASQKAALKVVKEGAAPDVADLGKEALLDIERIKTLGDPGVCSRCRWQSGCPSCDVLKCSRYHVRVLCRSLGKKPPEWAR